MPHSRNYVPPAPAYQQVGATPLGEFTPLLNLSKPTVNGPETSNNWGFDLNLNFDKIEAWVGPLPGRIDVIEDVINNLPGGGGSVTDGDKGDILVTASGTTWMLDDNVVTPVARALLDDTTVEAQRLTLGAIGEAPNDGASYVRQSQAWAPAESAGGLSTGEYTFNTTTAPPPSTGQMRLNNTGQTLANAIYLHDMNAVGVDVSNAIRLIVKGNVILVQDKASSGNYQVYEATGVPTDNVSYWTVPVKWIKGNSPYTAGRVIVAIFGLGVVVGEAPDDGQLYYRRGSNGSWVSATMSTIGPTGGVDGDVWYQVTV